MAALRRNLIALLSAGLALTAMLFVATASLAAAPSAAQRETMSQMPGDAPCQNDTIDCSTDCAVLCHALAFQPVLFERPTGYLKKVTYGNLRSALTSRTVDAEDPPPR